MSREITSRAASVIDKAIRASVDGFHPGVRDPIHKYERAYD
jgi:hypothetical protein